MSFLYSSYSSPVDEPEPSLLQRLQRYVQRPGVIDPGQGLSFAHRADDMLPERPMARALADRWAQAPAVEGGPGPGVPIVHRLPDEPRPGGPPPVVAAPPPSQEDQGGPLRYEMGGYQEAGDEPAPLYHNGGYTNDAYRDGGYRQEGAGDTVRRREEPPAIEYHDAGYQPAADNGGRLYFDGGYHQPEPEPEPLPVVTGRVTAPGGGTGPVLRAERSAPEPEPIVVSTAYFTPVRDIDGPYGEGAEPGWPAGQPQPYRLPDDPLRPDPGPGGLGGLVLPPNAYLDPGGQAGAGGHQPYQVLPYERDGVARFPEPSPQPWSVSPPVARAAPEPSGPQPLPHPLARNQVLPASTGSEAVPEPDDDDGDSDDWLAPFDDDDGPERPPLDEIDLALVVERMQRHMARRLDVERERRGGGASWR